MTSLPAARMKLWDRELVRPGFVADLTVFNPATVRDRSTFTAPRAYSEGVHQVMVNGEFVVDEGRITNARPGRPVLRTWVSRRTGGGRGFQQVACEAVGDSDENVNFPATSRRRTSNRQRQLRAETVRRRLSREVICRA